MRSECVGGAAIPAHDAHVLRKKPPFPLRRIEPPSRKARRERSRVAADAIRERLVDDILRRVATRPPHGTVLERAIVALRASYVGGERDAEDGPRVSTSVGGRRERDRRKLDASAL